jgi:hypothetical protein
MTASPRGRRALLAILALAASASAICIASSIQLEFAAENDAAMAKMMAGMNIKPSGDIDRDFVEMMIPHHQGAIDMCRAELRYGKSEQLRRICQEIIVDQLQEIAAMRLALNDPLPPSAPAPTQAPAPQRPAPEAVRTHN